MPAKRRRYTHDTADNIAVAAPRDMLVGIYLTRVEEMVG